MVARAIRDGLIFSNKGIADFANDGVVRGVWVRCIQECHNFGILLLQQLREKMLLRKICGIEMMLQI